ncbi:MAG: gephyrin-like molybdotransferase Glp [Thermodesulfobacteriota bacterium]
MSKPFLRVCSADAARDILQTFQPLGSEEVSLDDSLFRVTSEPVQAPADLPPFDRSTMDGFAVRAADTFGSSEGSPSLFRVVGEVPMGKVPGIRLGRGETVRIWTGGALPEGADAVVMVEHTQELDQQTVEIMQAVAPFDHVVRRGEDFTRGETLIPPGQRLRPQDMGLLAAMGMARIEVFRRPRVAVISSGDEIVPMEQEPPPGCMKDVNRHTISAAVTAAHATPIWIGIAADRLDVISQAIEKGLQVADIVVISGGSSMGSRDLVIEAITSHLHGRILIHGVSVSPGKPLIVAQVGSCPVIGLPGHPVSALVCFDQFVVPLLRRLEGEGSVGPYLKSTLQATLGRNVPSREGRTDFVRVRIAEQSGKTVAMHVPGKSGMISGMVRAHGYIQIPADCEGLYKGDPVTVHLFSNWLGEELETKHLSRHETAPGGTEPLPQPSRQEKLSGL